MIGLSLFMVNANEKEAKKTIDNVTTELGTSLKSKDSDVVSNILGEVAITNAHYENIRNYLMMDQQTYFEYMIDIWHETGTSVYFPDAMKTIFLNYGDVKSIDIVFDDLDVYLHGDRDRVMGKKLDKPFKKPSKELTLVRAIRDPGTSIVNGTIYITFSEDSLTSFYNKNQSSQQSVNTFIFNSHNEIIYSSQNGLSKDTINQLKNAMSEKSWVSEKDLKNGYYVGNISVKDLSVVTILDKKEVRMTSFIQILIIFSIGLTVISLLLFFLNKVFKKYSNQMEQLVKVTNQVSAGNLEAQVDTSMMQLELNDLAEAFNQMIINLNKYIEDIYLLEIKQRDAHMRALQSQINPHFLYNTLEYIRMYALSNQQTELADVVYAFSALLRNNITQEKTTTLKEELDFCEKYVYLYQMRYPDSIAYHFIVDEGLDKFVIPKFIIQPLIENYFVHGIDYERQDNAISVKAHQYKDGVEIRIIDNGLGMSQERLEEVNLKLTDNKTLLQNSIGISNVYQRIRGFFGEESEMRLESIENKGVTIIIRIKEQGEGKDNV
ncbi:Two-component sensor kinase YesM [Vagococcus fluvialis bH819]|uniref:Two-component sensor kinase YesM n=2 Tax=Enterococcaceae TaxID=81852 RepID=A0A1X6WKD0_9ENTE|nr:Two-component sensor kinase YesM [Vagococcus fluvialis bH819]